MEAISKAYALLDRGTQFWDLSLQWLPQQAISTSSTRTRHDLTNALLLPGLTLSPEASQKNMNSQPWSWTQKDALFCEANPLLPSLSLSLSLSLTLSLSVFVGQRVPSCLRPASKDPATSQIQSGNLTPKRPKLTDPSTLNQRKTLKG